MGHPDTRAEVLRELTERGISFEELAASSEQPDADPFDLLCHLGWNAPLLTRRQRAEAAKRQAKTCLPNTGIPPVKFCRRCSTVMSSVAFAIQHAVRADEGTTLRPLRQSFRNRDPSLRRRARHEGRRFPAADGAVPITRIRPDGQSH